MPRVKEGEPRRKEPLLGPSSDYKAGLLRAAELAEEETGRFAAYAKNWKEAHNDARRRGISEEAFETVGRMLTWKEARMSLLNHATRLRAEAEE